MAAQRAFIERASLPPFGGCHREGGRMWAGAPGMQDCPAAGDAGADIRLALRCCRRPAVLRVDGVRTWLSR
jgi:hypothetical protein